VWLAVVVSEAVCVGVCVSDEEDVRVVACEGVPLTVPNCDSDCEDDVLEVGVAVCEPVAVWLED
jgi:hypothetical protein